MEVQSSRVRGIPLLAGFALAFVSVMCTPTRRQAEEDLFMEGDAKSSRGDVEGAIRDYDEVIRLQPNCPIAYYKRGIAKYVKGDMHGAFNDYYDAICLQPNYPEAYSNRGAVQLALFNYDAARRDFDEAIRLRPNYPQAYYNRGISKYEKGDLDGAIRDFDEAIRLKRDFSEAYHNRGFAKDEKGDMDGAIADYDEAIRLKPGDHAAYNDRGLAKYGKCDWDGAIRDFDESIRLRKDISCVHASRGQAKLLIGDKEGGRADLTKAADLDPGNAYAVIWLVGGLGGDRGRLENIAEGKDWISNVVRFYLGRMTREQILAEARRASRESAVQKRLCEAHGYIGLLAEKDGDVRLARASYEACVATGVTHYSEYVWAKARLAAMFKDKDEK